MRCLVTGASGFVGQALTRRIRHDMPSAELVLFDTAAPADTGQATVIVGDLADRQAIARAVEDRVDLVFHLAAVPGGAAEADPRAGRRVNVDATLDLFEALARQGGARVVYASTIAVLGDNLPALVDDQTPPVPALTYGAQKLMMELALADFSRRGELDGLSLRLPGITARPPGPSGMRSAFMSEVFHALKAREPFTSPVSPQATFWLMSMERCVDNFMTAAAADLSGMPPGRAVTLPALRVSMGNLAAAIARATGADPASVDYAPDPEIEASFGSYPALSTPTAERLGLRHDGSVADLVERVLGGPDTGRKVASGSQYLVNSTT